jgi:threonyl-tRNA synthetase
MSTRFLSLSQLIIYLLKPDNAMGDPALWEQAENALKTALEQNGIKYGLKEKEGAFYGPKIDIQIKGCVEKGLAGCDDST